MNPEFAHYFFIHEHFERFLTDVHERAEPWWWFFLWLPVGSLPWISIALHGLRQQWQLDSDATFRPRQFLIAWIAVILLFFSVSHSKLIPYVLPAIPALALIGADNAMRMRMTTLRSHLIAISIWWAAIVGYALFGPLAETHGASPDLVRKLFNWAACAFGAMCAASLVAQHLVARPRRIDSMIALSLGTLVGLSTLLLTVESGRAVASGYDLAQAIKPHLSIDKPFYSVNDYDQTLPFYLKRTMTLVGYQTNGGLDLDFGQAQEPEKRLVDVAAFAAQWLSDPAGSLAVINTNVYKSLAEQNLPMTVIGRNVDLTAVIKP